MIPSTTIVFLFLITVSSSWAEDDVQCLRDFKSSVSDPQGYLSSWNFSDTSYGRFRICGFFGVTCWTSYEDRILSLSLPNSSLSGPVASVLSSLRLCSSITSINLSSNSFTGSIPASISGTLPFLVQLDLSSNSLTGSIPPTLSNCTFLYSLNLSSNLLSGSIPHLLYRPSRLTILDLSNNSLSGPVPFGLLKFGASQFCNNPSLCGYPLSSACKNPSTPSIVVVIINLASAVSGFLFSLLILYLFSRFGFSPKSLTLKKKTNRTRSPDDRVTGSRGRSNQLRSSSHGRLIPVSMFRKALVELNLADLTTATEDFHPDNIMVAGSPDLGTSYKAVLSDGSALIVKRLHGCALPERLFQAEMGRIGQIRHPNLASLLGFCVADGERLLIYRNVDNGSLSSLLRAGDENLDWPTRLRIAVGVARGLALLHHGFPVPFLHQNFNSSAILLDEDYEPKIIDFGLSGLMRMNSPAMADTPLPSTNADVYEFGVVLLELTTHGKAMEVVEDLVTRVTELCLAGQAHEAIDGSLRGEGNEDEIVEVLKVACECVGARPHERPSMHDVYGLLKRIASGHEFSEQFEEFPVVVGCSKDELDATELVKLAYCIYTGRDPF